MTTLQTRLAQADKPTRELLVECYAAVFGAPSLEWRTEDDRARRFTAMLDAEAWTSAVEMLVPQGDDVCLTFSEGPWVMPQVRLWSCDPDRENPFDVREMAPTFALALAIACLKARGR